MRLLAGRAAASGAGKKGMNELTVSTKFDLTGRYYNNQVFSHNLAFNLIPHIDSFQDNGYTKEEMKMNWELKKIFKDSNLLVSCTSVRIPVMRSHSISVSIETNQEIDLEDIRKLIQETEGVDLIDDPANNIYPMPIYASHKHNVDVGRIRHSLVFGKLGLDLFISGDQLLRGAALNAYQIFIKNFQKN